MGIHNKVWQATQAIFLKQSASEGGEQIHLTKEQTKPMNYVGLDCIKHTYALKDPIGLGVWSPPPLMPVSVLWGLK